MQKPFQKEKKIWIDDELIKDQNVQEEKEELGYKENKTSYHFHRSIWVMKDILLFHKFYITCRNILFFFLKIIIQKKNKIITV